MEPNPCHCLDCRHPGNRTAAAADVRGSSGAGAKDRPANSREAAHGRGSFQECANSEGNSRESIHGHDDAYFAPLKDLQLQPGTELYLGLVHAQDGIEGTKKRIAAAKKYVPKFGVASECGISRGRNADLAMDFIKTYAAAAATA